jgi:uncharacterized surface protein with fasciclin (FAS1) repeats
MNQKRPGRLRRLLSTAAIAGLTIGAAACGSDDAAISVDATDVEEAVGTVVDQAETASADLAQTLRDNGLDTVASVVDQIDPDDLIGGANFTFFAPNDEAFTSLGAGDTADLLTDPGRVLEVLRNHIVAQTISAEDLATADTVDTEAGETLEVSVDDGVVRLGDVTVVSTGIAVGDGVIHVVDGLLLVP